MEPVLPKHMAKCHSCAPLQGNRLRTHLIVKQKTCVTLRRDDQSWLGRAILYPRRHLSTPEEFFNANEHADFLDLHETRNRLDRVYKHCFPMIYSNEAQLGNLTLNEKGDVTNLVRYQHMHCHYIPRYDLSFEFAGFKFHDTQFGKALNIDPEHGHVKVVVPPLVMKLFKDTIQESFIEKGLLDHPNDILHSGPSVEVINKLAEKNLCLAIPGCRLTLVRHGATDCNKANEERLQGTTDVPLNDSGLEQAELTRIDLSQREFAAAYSSTLKRALTTAEIITNKKSLPITQSPFLVEASMGNWEGRTKAEYERWCAKQPQPKLPKADSGDSVEGDQEIADYLNYKFDNCVESSGEVFKRFKQFLSGHAAKHIGQNILVVAHGGNIRALIDHCYFSPLYTPVVANCARVELFYSQSGELSISGIHRITWKKR